MKTPSTRYITITELRRHLEKYLDASQETDFIITRYGHPIFVLVGIARWIELYEEIRSNLSDLDQSG